MAIFSNTMCVMMDDNLIVCMYEVQHKIEATGFFSGITLCDYIHCGFGLYNISEMLCVQ